MMRAEIFLCRGGGQEDSHVTTSVPASSSSAYQTKKPERHWTLLQEQSVTATYTCGLQETPSNLDVGSW